jgi:hypothetical protein
VLLAWPLLGVHGADDNAVEVEATYTGFGEVVTVRHCKDAATAGPGRRRPARRPHHTAGSRDTQSAYPSLPYPSDRRAPTVQSLRPVRGWSAVRPEAVAEAYSVPAAETGPRTQGGPCTPRALCAAYRSAAQVASVARLPSGGQDRMQRSRAARVASGCGGEV